MEAIGRKILGAVGLTVMSVNYQPAWANVYNLASALCSPAIIITTQVYNDSPTDGLYISQISSRGDFTDPDSFFSSPWTSGPVVPNKYSSVGWTHRAVSPISGFYSVEAYGQYTLSAGGTLTLAPDYAQCLNGG